MTDPDAVLASSSWHWMEPVETLREVARVLVPGGTLGVVWSGPDPNGAFLTTAQALLTERAGPRREGSAGEPGLGAVLRGVTRSPEFALEIPDGAPFGLPEHEAFAWDVAMGQDDLIGLLGTFSWIITLDDDARARVLAEARTLLREFLEAEGTATGVDLVRHPGGVPGRDLASGGLRAGEPEDHLHRLSTHDGRPGQRVVPT